MTDISRMSERTVLAFGPSGEEIVLARTVYWARRLRKDPTAAERALSDMARTEVIESHGWRVLRFTNAQVLQDVDRVLAAIREEAQLIRTS